GEGGGVAGVGWRGDERLGLQFHPAPAPWHFLNFFPLPHGHGSLRPTFGSSRLTVFSTSSPPVLAGTSPARRPDAASAPFARATPAKAGIGSAPGLLVMIGMARRGAGRGAVT